MFKQNTKTNSLVSLEQLTVNSSPWTSHGHAEHLQQLIHCKETIITFQKSLKKQTSSPDYSQQNNHKFEEWLRLHGVFGNYNVKYFGPDRGNGLIATASIPHDSVIMSIPHELILSPKECSRHDPAYDKAFMYLNSNPLLCLVPSVRLGLCLLYECFKEDKSFYYPYINILPSSLSLPLFFSFEDVEMLRSSKTAYRKAVECIYNVIKQYCYLFRILENSECIPFPLSYFTLERYLWAIGIVLSRQNKIPQNDTEDSLVLIPGWDICNHEMGHISTSFDLETQTLTCSAMRLYVKGEEITIFYGSRTNTDFLVYAGFSPSFNPHDIIDLTIEMNIDDPFYGIKKLIIQKLGKENIQITDCKVEIKVGLKQDGSIYPSVAISQVCVLTMTKVELAEALRSIQQQSTLSMLPQVIHSRALKVLEQFGTTLIQQHEFILEKKPSTFNTQLIHSFLEREKSILKKIFNTK